MRPADVVSEVGGVSTSVGGRRRLDCFVLGGFWYRVYRCEASIEVAMGGFFSSRLKISVWLTFLCRKGICLNRGGS